MLLLLRPFVTLCAASFVLSMAVTSQQPEHPSCCATSVAALPPLPPDASPKETWLRRIHDEAEQVPTNLYLSSRYLEELRLQLDRVEASGGVRERCARRWELAEAELRVGEVASAIVRLEQSVAIAEAEPTEGEALLPNLLFRLAVAHFRDAEKQNCIANHNVDSCILPLSPRAVHQQKDGAEACRAVLERLLALPSHSLRLEAMWLLNIAHMALGSWPDGVPADQRIPVARFASETPIGHFVDVGRDLGLARRGHAGSVILDDFTGDGLLDVLTTKFDTDQPLRLCRNDGNGRFVDMTDEAGLGRQLGGVNVVHGDIDGDGLLDVLVLRGGGFAAQSEFPNSLLRQDRPGHFVDVTAAAGVEIAAPTRTAAFADVDRDGDLDLFIGYESETIFLGSETGPAARERFPSRLFQNDGTGRFTDVTEASGIRNPHHCTGAVFGDIDGDGDPDLFLSNFMAKNRLLVNRGDGTFTDETKARGVGGWRESGPAGFFDYDNDGDLDLFLTSCRHIRQVGTVAAYYIDGRIEGTTQELFENDGKGRFEIVTEARGLRRSVTATGLNFGDVDNDGCVDLYIGTGANDFAALFPNVLLLNGDRFRDATMAAGVGHLQKCHGIAFGDLDDDGDLDLALSVGGFYQDDLFGDVVFQNPGNTRHWLSIELRGVRDNRFGLGARIQVRVEGADGPRDLYQTIGMGASFGGNPLRAHIGLGDARRVQFVAVRWPATGESQRFEGVPLDAAIRVVQDQDGFETLIRQSIALGARRAE